MEGGLPGKCANLAFPYIAMQGMNAERYDQAQALAAGTLFPGLNLPFFKAVKSKMNCDNTALCELMALSFAITELGLYLDTHQNDKEALALYTDYVSLAKEGKKRYEAAYGPLQQTSVTTAGYTWLNNPWPWELEGGNR
ncbi:MAG: spore coat associated protein CotJA [Oscillospiraceae bacterium]|jgi:spore coat protein JB|nr:spore coat associated protein CotJA [Oscillospiraceae bacterium]MCI8758807.1 spore coat associated protein CotJA [Oscillospiraceae bacterium]MCI9564196.1 spore coat associated protein CotJA [Oscillospiraceae bacterium]